MQGVPLRLGGGGYDFCRIGMQTGSLGLIGSVTVTALAGVEGIAPVPAVRRNYGFFVTVLVLRRLFRQRRRFGGFFHMVVSVRLFGKCLQGHHRKDHDERQNQRKSALKMGRLHGLILLFYFLLVYHTDFVISK